MATVIEMRGISKRFPGVIANEGVDFDLREGEIHALLGENGAGKTTLMKILYGLLRPDEGEIRIRGRRAMLRSPQAALALGIGMVHQHYMLVPTMTAAENIVLGRETTRGPFLLARAAVRRIQELSGEYGLAVHPERIVADLSVGEQQRVEILKALYHGADVLILDEPTAAITPLEADALFHTLRSMTARGRSVIFISHKLREVMAISQRITVLLKGKTVGTVAAADTTEGELARLMIARDLESVRSRTPGPTSPGEVVAALRGIGAKGGSDRPALAGLDLDVRSGEIVGVAGVDGNGQRELAEVLAGVRTPDEGRVLLGGRDVTAMSPRRRNELGVWYVPADRRATGAVTTLSIAMNAILKSHRRRPFARWGVLNHSRAREFAEDLVRTYDIRCPSVRVAAGVLSGGNLQKLILARETAQSPRLLVAEHPTRGLDVGATEYVREVMVRAARGGAAVLLISADLEEILGMSDRIVVMYEGAIVHACSRGQVDLERLALAMAGRGVVPAPGQTVGAGGSAA